MEKDLPLESAVAERKRQTPKVLISLALAVSVAFLLFLAISGGSGQRHSYRKGNFSWQEVTKGLLVGRYELGSENQILKSEVLLLKIDPKRFELQAISASELKLPNTDLRTLTLEAGGLAGINAHFFDQRGKALGLLIREGEELNKMHQGGKLLTGVFYIKDGKPDIIQRDEFREDTSELAIQSGPRLIIDGKKSRLKPQTSASRRSGVAVTKKGEVIIYATMLRFPGASLQQIQEMLLDPALAVESALNLDGGGSSQLFIRKNKALADDTFVSGGDAVPVGLIVRGKKHTKKNTKSANKESKNMTGKNEDVS